MKFRSGLMIAGFALVAGLSACDSKLSATAPAMSASAPATTPAQSPLCTAPVLREVGLTAPDAKDRLEVEALGADCRQSVIVIALRNAADKLLWTRAVEAGNTGAFIPDQDDKPVIPAEGVHNQLEAILKSAAITKSKAAPDWPLGKERPEEPGGLFHTTEFTRETYLETRAKDLPMLCLDHRMGGLVCVVFDPMTPDIATEFYQSSS